MIVIISFILVLFPACIALLIHDRLMPLPDGAARKWMWYGAYCAVISWAVLLVKLIRLGGALTVITAFQDIRALVSYGLVSLIIAVILPLVISIVELLLVKYGLYRSKP